MKRIHVLASLCAILLGASSIAPLSAQERGQWSLSVGADAVSHYLWRGMELGGPSLQPSAYFDYAQGDWTVSLGMWGTKSLLANRYGDHYAELDLSAEASWRNLTLSLTDYAEGRYFGPWHQEHALDLGLSLTLSENVPVTFSWYTILNKYHEAALMPSGYRWSEAFPSYFEVAYDFSLSVVDFSVAAGMLPFASGYYENDSFGICNLHLSAGHEFEFQHGGTLPVAAQLMYNPMGGEFFWGLSVGYYFSLDL